MAMRTLNVKKVTKTDLSNKWQLPLPKGWGYLLYIRCNKKGEVNWDKAPVYTPVELIERGNYKVSQ